VVARFVGRRLAYTYEVIDYAPAERLVIARVRGRLPHGDDLRLRDAAEGYPKMTLRNRGEPRGFTRLVAPFMRTAMRKANQKDLARLKTLLEGAVLQHG
jgi:hypothetical protein